MYVRLHSTRRRAVRAHDFPVRSNPFASSFRLAQSFYDVSQSASILCWLAASCYTEVASHFITSTFINATRHDDLH